MAGSMYDKIMKVITNPPESRQDKEIIELLPWFIKKSELFRTLKKDVITDLIKNCQFFSLERDYVIIRQGERGDRFYILLRGTVSIYINNVIADEEEDAGDCVKEDTFSADGELDRSKFGNWIAKIDDGKSFGELALINKNCIRNASIIADETSDLLIVNRELYNRCLHAAQAAEFEQRTNFVANQPIFENWAHKYKKQMAMSIRKVFVDFEESIIHQGDRVNTLYFLLKGQAKIVIDPAQHPVQYPQFYPLEDPDEILAREEMEETLAFRKKDAIAVSLLSPIIIYPFEKRIRELPRKTIEVSIVGHNEIIGDAEMALDLKTYVQTVTVTHKCDLYALDMKNYERLVVRRNTKTIEKLRDMADMKLSLRVQRFHDNQLPLLKTLLFHMRRRGERKQRKRHIGAYTTTGAPLGSDGLSQRGPLIDQYGPGTVYYRVKMREKAQREQKERLQFRGANPAITTLKLTPLSKPPPVMWPVHEVYSDSDDGYDEMFDAESPCPRGHPLASTFKDWDSSNRELTQLEERIKAWHNVDGSSGCNKGRAKFVGPSTVRLRRVTLQKGKPPKPGTKVVLRPRRQRGNQFLFESPNSDVTNGQPYTDSTEPLKQHSAGDANTRNEEEEVPSSVHSCRISGPQETATLSTTIDGLHRSCVATHSVHTLSIPSGLVPVAQHHVRANLPPPLDASGTILDILKRCRQPSSRWTANGAG